MNTRQPLPHSPAAGTSSESNERRDGQQRRDSHERCDAHVRYNDPPPGVDPTTIDAMGDRLKNYITAKITGAVAIPSFDLNALTRSTVRVVLNRARELVIEMEVAQQRDQEEAVARAHQLQDLAEQEDAVADQSGGVPGTRFGDRPRPKKNVTQVEGNERLHVADLGDIFEVDEEEPAKDETKEEGPKVEDQVFAGWLEHYEEDDDDSDSGPSLSNYSNSLQTWMLD